MAASLGCSRGKLKALEIKCLLRENWVQLGIYKERKGKRGAKTKSVLEFILDRKVSWCGHLRRASDNVPAKIYGRPEWRTRGIQGVLEKTETGWFQN